MTTPSCWKTPPERAYRVAFAPVPPPVTPACTLLIGARRKMSDCQSVFGREDGSEKMTPVLLFADHSLANFANCWAFSRSYRCATVCVPLYVSSVNRGRADCPCFV